MNEDERRAVESAELQEALRSSEKAYAEAKSLEDEAIVIEWLRAQLNN